MVVEAYEVDSSALEQQVTGVRFITSCCYRAERTLPVLALWQTIVIADNLYKVFGEDGVGMKAIGVLYLMTGIENHVRLLEGELVGTR